MDKVLFRNVKLALSASLLTLWGCGTLQAWPYFGRSDILLFAALVLQWRVPSARQHQCHLCVGVSLAIIVGSLLFGFWLGDEFYHSVYGVLPFWALGFWAIVYAASRPEVVG